MSRTQAKKRNRRKAAFVKTTGGCFSVTSFPFVIILLLSAVFLMALGETSSPLEIEATDNQAAVGSQTGSRTNPAPIAHLFTPEVQYWGERIVQWAHENDLDPNLVATVMQIESCGDPLAQSGAGAQGLFQVMPYHFQTGEKPLTPNTNARRGLAYLRQALDTHSSVRLAFAGYNGGISTAGRAESLWPAETIRYTYWGINIYQDAKAGKASSATLTTWLQSGGASLCAQANQHLGLNP